MHMKQLTRKLVPLIVLLGVLCGSSAFGQARIATVDLRKIFDGYWKKKQAMAAMTERGADLEKEAKGLRDDFAKAREDYQKLQSASNDQAVSSEEREKRKKAAETKLKDLKDMDETIQQFEKQARSTMEEQSRRMRENILTEIRAAITAKAKAGSYSLVFDTAAETPNGTPVMLYSSGTENDMTDAILSQLNATAPPESAKPDEKKDDKKEPKKDEKK
ncbi:MAG: OmpH family outer membrane protein [Verrucomicrobia bacterium]|nr:MAG: OmpH family outer membrane protein [Verrucomicrobiota bacterium]